MDKSPANERRSDREENAQDRLGLEAVAAMCQAAINKFENIDTDKSGYLSKVELEDASVSTKYSQLERQQFKMLARHADEIQQVVHHGWKFRDDNRGIHRRDLSLLGSWMQPRIESLESNRALRDVLTRNLSKIDRDGNNEISYSELGAARKLLDIDRADRLALTDAYERWESYSSRSVNSRTRATSIAFFDQNIKELTDRNGSRLSHQKMVWAIADAFRTSGK